MQKSSGKLGKVTGYLLLTVNVLTALWLGICYKASVTPPAAIKDIALFSLTTALAICVNVLFIIFWLFTKKKARALVSVAALFICGHVVLEVVGLNFFSSNDMAHRPGTVKVMSWNVHGLGIYDKKGNTNAAGILETIRNEAPDVLFMPEFSWMYDDSTRPFTMDVLNQNHFTFHRFNLDNGYGPYYHLGNTVFSKYPIVQYKVYQLDEDIYLLQCDVQLPGRIVRMCTIHLCSYELSGDDRTYLSEVKQKKIPSEQDLQESRSYIYRFNTTYIQRSLEADSVAAILKTSPYPVLICGDFNEMPASYSYTTIRGKLADAFVAKGKGFGRTYNQIFATLRIDHILYDPTALHVIGYRSPSLPYSDHNAVIANFEIK